MKITRKQVLEAIRTEKLHAGAFLRPRYEGVDRYMEDSRCEVCAVGAVLRHVGIPNSEINDRASNLLTVEAGWTSDSDEFEELEDGNFLAALSIKFEKLVKKNGGAEPKTKTSLYYFVRRHFPKEFETVGK
jgi:hypothetical protein